MARTGQQFRDDFTLVGFFWLNQKLDIKFFDRNVTA